MGWESRGGSGRYFTRTRRLAGRVVREYVGCGPAAEVAALLAEADHAERVAKRMKLAEERDAIAEARGATAALDRAAKEIVHSEMRAAGYHLHARSHWRKSRMTWNQVQDDDDDPLIEPGSGPRSEGPTTEQLWAFLHHQPIPPARPTGVELVEAAEAAWVSLISSTSAVTLEMLEEHLQEFRAALGPAHSPLERVLIGQLGVAMLESMFFDMRAPQSLEENATDAHREFLSRGADRATRKFAFLSKQLATVRRLLQPVPTRGIKFQERSPRRKNRPEADVSAKTIPDRIGTARLNAPTKKSQKTKVTSKNKVPHDPITQAKRHD